MGKKLTQKEFITSAKNIHIDKYDYSKVEYKNSFTKVKIICNKCNYFFNQKPSKHLSGQGCPECGKIARYINHRGTFDNFKEKANKIHNNKFSYDLSNYVNVTTKIKIQCLSCFCIFEQTPDSHLHGHGCDKCAKIKSSLKLRMSKEDFEFFAKKSHPQSNYDYSRVKYINAHTNVIIICPQHGEFEQTPSNHIHGMFGCTFCPESKGEKMVKDILIKNQIYFISQKRFDDCKFKNTLPFDFYLPEQNICIEYDGEQHFKAIEIFGGKKSFKERQVNDKIKTEYCKKNNIKLLRIPYTELKNVENIMSNYLN